MRIIGVTGGIGSGKSTVLELLERDYGAKVILADQVGHQAMEQGTPTYFKMVDTFGTKIVTSEGEIDRAVLAEILFSSSEQLQLQNEIVHPFVNEYISKRISQWGEADTVNMIVIESAILFESGCDQFCKEVWLVLADDEARIRRLQKSRGYTREKAQLYMGNQCDYRRYCERCSCVIQNDEDIEKLSKELKKCIEQSGGI